jgi:hypothetical protein
MLGYQEMADFRAAVKRGDVPGPCRSIKSGRRTVDAWSQGELEAWIDNRNDDVSTRRALNDDIGALA